MPRKHDPVLIDLYEQVEKAEADLARWYGSGARFPPTGCSRGRETMRELLAVTLVLALVGRFLLEVL
jgi:hypothetical protein